MCGVIESHEALISLKFDKKHPSSCVGKRHIAYICRQGR